MNGAGLMSVIERSRNWFEQGDGVFQPECAAPFEDGMQWQAIDILHRNVVQTLILANIVHGNDIGMSQVGRSSRLALEPFDKLCIQA